MKIIESKEVIRKQLENVIVGRKCDVCGKQIQQMPMYGYNYFLIHTWHMDWGNDSVDSHEYIDACCAKCVMEYVEPYVSDAYSRPCNTHSVEIEHIRTLEDGSD